MVPRLIPPYPEAFTWVAVALKAALLDEHQTAVFYAQMRYMSRRCAGVDAFAER
jgi:hypothetical protein